MALEGFLFLRYTTVTKDSPQKNLRQLSFQKHTFDLFQKQTGQGSRFRLFHILMSKGFAAKNSQMFETRRFTQKNLKMSFEIYGIEMSSVLKIYSSN